MFRCGCSLQNATLKRRRGLSHSSRRVANLEGASTMTKEPPIVIEDREELIFMLSEAAALEHMIMCEYLFAAFSLTRDVSEGVTAAQRAATTRQERGEQMSAIH